MLTSKLFHQTKQVTVALKTSAIIILSAMTLTGCYVEVGHDYDTDVDSYGYLTDLQTSFLVDAALIPFALASESPNMVINPDAYTTPKTRSLNRALITETTYAYLFENWDCDYGGYTKTTAEAETTSYDNDYTYVELDMSAKAFNCQVRSNGSLHTVNSDLYYNVTGWYDDWNTQISSLDSSLTGQVNIAFDGKYIRHRTVNVTTLNLSATDFSMNATSSMFLDDGYDQIYAALSTYNPVHWYLGATHPHKGQVRMKDGGQWVELTFDSYGVWREDSTGWEKYRTWSELGFN